MYAIVKEGNGRYYTSTVFGYYDKGKDRWDSNHRYWVVLNREKTALVNQNFWKPDTKYIVKLMLITDSDRHDWILGDDHAESVDYLPRESLLDMVWDNAVPSELLQKCIEIDKAYAFNPYPEILTQKDIEDFDWVSGSLHDAYVDKMEMQGDSLYVLFDGVWGCKIEVWFTGDVSYDLTTKDPEEYGKWWYSSVILIQDGFIYLIDDDCATVEDITNGYSYFKAKQMKYHVIPD